MDFSLFYFANNQEFDTDRYRLLLDGAKFADRNGFSAVWIPERHFHAFGGIYPNPSVLGAAVAMLTERIKIRAGSVVAPLHHPLRIAEEWSVVDNLSGGRVGLSFASGWHAIDFALRPENYNSRRELTLDYTNQVRQLWRGSTIPVIDGTGSPQQVGIFPAPIQKELPFWLTSAGNVETFRSAGYMGAGLLSHMLGQDPDDLALKIVEYRKAAVERESGHGDGWRGHVTLMVHTYLGENDDEVRKAVRAPLSEYIRSSLDLLLRTQTDLAGLPADDVDYMVERSFDRYFDDGGLLGTVAKARRVVDRFRAMGVDEVACLVDFGLPTETVLSGLDRLNDLRKLFEAVPRTTSE